MINSRQIVEIIQSEISQQKDTQVVQVLKKIVDRIELLEDMELSQMYKEYVQQERTEREKTLTRLASEFENVFTK